MRFRANSRFNDAQLHPTSVTITMLLRAELYKLLCVPQHKKQKLNMKTLHKKTYTERSMNIEHGKLKEPATYLNTEHRIVAEMVKSQVANKTHNEPIERRKRDRESDEEAWRHLVHRINAECCAHKCRNIARHLYIVYARHKFRKVSIFNA